MKNDFSIIAAFLNKVNKQEVSGRDAEPLSTEWQTRLESFASGKCSAKERQSICQMMKEKPEWISYVADRVKKSRCE